MRSPCTPQAHPGRHLAVTASQTVTAAAVLVHEDKGDDCTGPVGHTEEVKVHFIFNVCVYPYCIICLLLEAAFSVLSERHSLLTTGPATAWCFSSLPPLPAEKYTVGCGFSFSPAVSAETALTVDLYVTIFMSHFFSGG